MLTLYMLWVGHKRNGVCVCVCVVGGGMLVHVKDIMKFVDFQMCC